ncbi:MAG: hypothetical protein VZQ55_03135 [Ruminococcus sp.]|nr:hypothetical protein [Ruminococcus sp.]
MIQNKFQQNSDLLKKFFSSPILLALAILSFMSAFIQIISTLMGSAIFGVASASYISQLSETFAGARGLPIIGSGLIIGISLPSQALIILTAVSFLLFFLNSRKAEKSLETPSKIYKVTAIIEIVFQGLSALIAIVCVIIALVAISSAYNHSSTYSSTFTAFITGVIIGYLIGYFFVTALGITKGIGKLIFANSIKKSVQDNTLINKGAILFAVFCFLSAGTSIISSIINLSSLSIFQAFAGVISAASLVLEGILAIQYSQLIKKASNTSYPASNSGFTDPSYPVNNSVYPEYDANYTDNSNYIYYEQDNYYQAAPQEDYNNYDNYNDYNNYNT